MLIESFVVDVFKQKISSWVATEIVNCATVKQRVALIKRFILAAQHCLQYKNYNGLLEIIFGLNNLSINRLQQTWKVCNKRIRTKERNPFLYCVRVLRFLLTVRVFLGRTQEVL
jgi:hypothetical protein